MILPNLNNGHLSQILCISLSIDLILFLGEIINFNFKDKSRTMFLWKLNQGFSL